MKISHSELVQIIKEEVERYKKIKLLENRRMEILNKLNEMKVCQECGQKYEESIEEDMEENMEEGSDKMVDEILSKLLGKKSPEEKKADMQSFIMKHPTYSQVPGDIAEKYKKDEKHILDKLVEFFVKEGTLTDNNTRIAGIKAFVYDPKADAFVNKTKVSVPYGPSSGTGEI